MRKQKSVYPLVVFLLGGPASGKNTQAEKLQKKYDCAVFSSGDAFRRLEKTNSDPDLKKVLQKTLDKGALVPSLVYKKVLRMFLERHFSKTSKYSSDIVVFNGNPRQLVEARLLLKLLSALGFDRFLTLYLNLPKKVVLARVGLRRKKENRKDDAFSERRLKEQDKHSQAVLDFLKKYGKIVKVKAEDSRVAVARKINSEIQKGLKFYA